MYKLYITARGGGVEKAIQRAGGIPQQEVGKSENSPSTVCSGEFPDFYNGRACSSHSAVERNGRAPIRQEPGITD